MDLDNQTVLKNPDRYLNMIQDENQIIRRDAIKTISAELQSAVRGEKTNLALQVTIEEAMLVFLRPVTLLIRDPLEKTREVAYELLGLFILRLPKQKLKEILPTLIPIMVERLGQPELNEPSEEVRLLAVHRLEDLLNKLGTDLNPFIDDMIQILANTITDPFHTVRILSCGLASQVAEVCRTVFHYNSERLLRPLCSSISHQQQRVRVAVVDCIRKSLVFIPINSFIYRLIHDDDNILHPLPQIK